MIGVWKHQQEPCRVADLVPRQTRRPLPSWARSHHLLRRRARQVRQAEPEAFENLGKQHVKPVILICHTTVIRDPQNWSTTADNKKAVRSAAFRRDPVY